MREARALDEEVPGGLGEELWDCNPVPTSTNPLNDGQQRAEKGIPAPQREQSSIKLKLVENGL